MSFPDRRMAESRGRVRLRYREAEAAMVDLADRTSQGPQKRKVKSKEERERIDERKEIGNSKKLTKEAKGRKQIENKVARKTKWMKLQVLPPLPEEAELFLVGEVVGKVGEQGDQVVDEVVGQMGEQGDQVGEVVGQVAEQGEQVVDEVVGQADSATGKFGRKWKRRSKEERENQEEEALQKKIKKKEALSAERLEMGRKKTEAMAQKRQEKKEARESKKSNKELDRRRIETEKKGALQRENERKYAMNSIEGKWGRVAGLPPLPEEAALFEKSAPRRVVAEVCGALVAWLDTREVGEVAEVHQVAAALQVEVKKLYICYSVLEGLGMVGRVGSTTSTTYVLRGGEEVEHRLGTLYQTAVEEGVLDKLNSTSAEDTPATAPNSPYLATATEDGREVQEQENLQEGRGSGEVQERLKEKLTIGALTQQLMKVFLVSPVPRTLTMAAVARVAGERGHRVVARLVGACRVLAELGLVQEVQADPTIPHTRAAAFQYVGPVVEVVEVVEVVGTPPNIP